MKKRAIQYALLFLVTGLILTVMVGYVERKTIRTYEESLPYLTLGETVKNRIIRAQLGMEEIASGDRSVSFENDVLPSITSSLALLKDAYEGKSNGLGKFAKNSEELRILLKEPLIHVEKVLGTSQTRSKVRTVSAESEGVAAVFSLEDKKISILFDQV